MPASPSIFLRGWYIRASVPASFGAQKLQRLPGPEMSPTSKARLTQVLKGGRYMNNRKSKMSTFSTPLKRAGALSATAALLGACTILGGGAAASASSTTTIRIAIVSNPQMADIEQLTPSFEKEYPNIKVVYDTLPEDTERALIETDIATQANEFNAVMISNYETPIWA